MRVHNGPAQLHQPFFVTLQQNSNTSRQNLKVVQVLKREKKKSIQHQLLHYYEEVAGKYNRLF